MSAPGETDLERLLATLTPTLDSERYWFASQPDTAPPDRALATFKEDEGLTFVVAGDRPSGVNTVSTGPFARLTLKVHSSLEAVGLTAAIAAALTDARISANVIAGFYHDHVFVAWADRDRALAVLEALQAEA